MEAAAGFPRPRAGTGTTVSRLATYLNDHLGGSTGGLELAKRASGSNEGNEYGPVLAELAREIEEDRDALIELMNELGVGRDRVKVLAGWSGEKLGRLKPNGSLLSYSPLSRLIEIEGLVIGVTGKLSLWENLRDALGDRVGEVDFVELAERARSQRARLDALRSAAAPAALAGDGGPVKRAAGS